MLYHQAKNYLTLRVSQININPEYICFLRLGSSVLIPQGKTGRQGRRIPILPFSNPLLRDRFADLLYCFSDFASRLSERFLNLAAREFRIALLRHFPITQSATDFSFLQSLCLVQLPHYFVLVR
jgi:hypothetical protein